MINLPEECRVDKFIPKKIFYEKVKLSSVAKQEFVDKVEKITWKYKISENNINVSKTDEIEEIEIFEIVLKEKYNSKNILNVVTKEISYPILFIIKYEEDQQYAIKFNDSVYFSDWNSELKFNFIGFNLEKVYENLVKTITHIDNDNKSVKEELERREEVERVECEILKIENQIRKEQQFNKKVELNKKLLELKDKKGELENNG